VLNLIMLDKPEQNYANFSFGKMKLNSIDLQIE